MIVSSKGSSWGAMDAPDARPWFMTAIIYQLTIDKKRKKCGIII
jgi:hypothetical protein